MQRKGYRKTYRKKDYGNKNVKKVARKEAKKVLDRNTETKYWDGMLVVVTVGVADPPVPIPASGYNYLITSTYSGGPTAAPPGDLSRGVEANDYIGDVIEPTYLMVNYIVQYPPSGDNINVVSLALFQGRGSFSPTWNDTGNQFIDAGDTLAPIGMIDMDYNDRLTLLKRHIITVDAEHQQYTGTFRIKGKKLRRIHFTSTGSIEANPIFLSTVSDSTAANHPALRATWRLYYKDC